MKSLQVKPDLATYHRLLEACSKGGLAVEAWAVFNDMLAMEIKPDARIFDSLLAAQRHNDSSEIWKVLAKMKELGMTLRPTTYGEIMQKFIVDENLEMALQLLKTMSSEKLAPTLETMTSLISLAAEGGHPRLALDLVASFEAATRSLPPEVWVRCLQSSARELYAEGALHAWDKVVNELQIVPDEGTCLEVLTTAARCGQPALARNVIRTMKSMPLDLQEYHMAPLVQSYCGDEALIKEAILTLNEIRDEGIVPSQHTAFPIFSLVEGDADAIDRVWSTVEVLQKRGTSVDITVLNALIQASAELGDTSRAMMVYRGVPRDLPNIDTFNFLLRACVLSSRREHGDRILADMKAAIIRPNAETFRHMTLLCLTQDMYEDAFYYLEETKAGGFNPDIVTYEALARKCAEEGDVRLKIVLEEMEERKMEVTPGLARFIRDAKMEKAMEQGPAAPFQPLDELAQKLIESGGVGSGR
ncbi:hypothetical protein BDV98DRAFT_504773 [Pterulicium gracile]|uniref:Pentatricopeptide repeat-containing protein-mitochondrial domain-containing protein n=1 Tax=Pterulicium gracile TaxID=1884261 RepID=A0A5C3QMI1_9AGAR|nr:hypothetical protein BDV98DRAFT_504773 [Pterula gracilis]